jgi:hypothetical protein
MADGSHLSPEGVEHEFELPQALLAELDKACVLTGISAKDLVARALSTFLNPLVQESLQSGRTPNECLAEALATARHRHKLSGCRLEE